MHARCCSHVSSWSAKMTLGYDCLAAEDDQKSLAAMAAEAQPAPVTETPKRKAPAADQPPGKKPNRSQPGEPVAYLGR